MQQRLQRLPLCRLASTTALLFLTGMTSFPHHSAAQTDEQFAPLVYPPLTEREGKVLKFPLPSQGHPRLFLRRGDVPLC